VFLFVVVVVVLQLNEGNTSASPAAPFEFENGHSSLGLTIIYENVVLHMFV
jgi:hypothetical protein